LLICSDEEDLRADQLLLKDQWRNLFDRFDPEGFGEIPWEEFLVVLATPEFCEAVPSEKIDVLLEKFHQNSSTSSAITFQEFVNVMSGKRTSSFKCAMHCRDRQVVGEGDFRLVSAPPLMGRLTQLVSRECLTDPRDRKYYSDRYTCWPPPFFIVTISLLELWVFSYYWAVRGSPGIVDWPQLGDGTWEDTSLDSVLAYCPNRKTEAWRWLSYLLVHSSCWHIAFNLIVQIVLGLPLEMVHGSGRVAVIYIAGVLAGSLATSVLDPGVCLVGASGGVYSLLAGHLANIVLNYTDMQCGVLRLVTILAVASTEVGLAVYGRYDDTSGSPTSYLAHIAGSAAGATLGLVVLKNFQQKLWDRWIWWVALALYIILTITAVAINISIER